MVRAGQMPLDRAHAHARWAERYDAQSDPQRAAAHFGRAMHYARLVQAFGARPKRESEEEKSRDIVVGRVEDGAEVWSTLRDLYSERRAAATKKRRVHEELHVQGGASSGKPLYAGPVGPVGYDYRKLPGMLDNLYASERSGLTGRVHSDAEGLWYIHRCESTGIVYLVPGRLATDAEGVMDLVKRVTRGNYIVMSSYTIALDVGMLIVQDQRPGRVQVERGGVWYPATEIETFAYYDFLLRYPKKAHNYVGEKVHVPEVLLSNYTPIPARLQDEENGNLDMALTRNRGCIYVGNNRGFESSTKSTIRSQISDVAYPLPS